MTRIDDSSQPDRRTDVIPERMDVDLTSLDIAYIRVITITGCKYTFGILLWCESGFLAGTPDGTAVFEDVSVLQISRLPENIDRTPLFQRNAVVIIQRQESEVICILIA